MAGAIVGLDLSEALASLALDLDRDLARRLFIAAESNFMRAICARENKNDE